MEQFTKQFNQWFASSPFASWLRSFLAVVLFEMVSSFSRTGSFDFSDWKNWLLAGVLAVAPVVLRALNPADKAFGQTS